MNDTTDSDIGNTWMELYESSVNSSPLSSWDLLSLGGLFCWLCEKRISKLNMCGGDARLFKVLAARKHDKLPTLCMQSEVDVVKSEATRATVRKTFSSQVNLRQSRKFTSKLSELKIEFCKVPRTVNKQPDDSSINSQISIIIVELLAQTSSVWLCWRWKLPKLVLPDLMI